MRRPICGLTLKQVDSFAMKILSALVFAAAFAFPLHSSAQTYTHEFVFEDGSSIRCTLRIAGTYSSQSSCDRYSFEQRKAGADYYIKAMGNLNDCADLSEATRSLGISSNYPSSVLQACLGRDPWAAKKPSDPMKAYLINCEGEMTNKQVDWGLYERGLKDCPGLAAIALEGRLPYRTKF